MQHTYQQPGDPGGIYVATPTYVADNQQAETNLSNVSELFPNTDVGMIRDVLAANDGDVQRTVDCLLQLVSDSEPSADERPAGPEAPGEGSILVHNPDARPALDPFAEPAEVANSDAAQPMPAPVGEALGMWEDEAAEQIVNDAEYARMLWEEEVKRQRQAEEEAGAQARPAALTPEAAEPGPTAASAARPVQQPKANPPAQGVTGTSPPGQRMRSAFSSITPFRSWSRSRPSSSPQPAASEGDPSAPDLTTVAGCRELLVQWTRGPAVLNEASRMIKNFLEVVTAQRYEGLSEGQWEKLLSGWRKALWHVVEVLVKQVLEAAVRQQPLLDRLAAAGLAQIQPSEGSSSGGGGGGGFKFVGLPPLTQIRQCLETIVMDLVHEDLWAVVSEMVADKDAQLRKTIAELASCSPKRLELKEGAEQAIEQGAKQRLAGVEMLRTPRQLAVCFTSAVTTMTTNAESMLDCQVAADDLVPMTAWLIVRSGVQQLFSSLVYVESFMHLQGDGEVTGQLAYLLTNFRVAAEWLCAGAPGVNIPPSPKHASPSLSRQLTPSADDLLAAAAPQPSLLDLFDATSAPTSASTSAPTDPFQSLLDEPVPELPSTSPAAAPPDILDLPLSSLGGSAETSTTPAPATAAGFSDPSHPFSSCSRTEEPGRTVLSAPAAGAAPAEGAGSTPEPALAGVSAADGGLSLFAGLSLATSAPESSAGPGCVTDPQPRTMSSELTQWAQELSLTSAPTSPPPTTAAPGNEALKSHPTWSPGPLDLLTSSPEPSQRAPETAAPVGSDLGLVWSEARGPNNQGGSLI